MPQPRTDAMFIESQPAMPRTNGTPYRGESNSMQGAGVKKNASVTQGGTRFLNGGPGEKRIPESALRLGRSFRMVSQTETASRNLSSEWDTFSG